MVTEEGYSCIAYSDCSCSIDVLVAGRMVEVGLNTTGKVLYVIEAHRDGDRLGRVEGQQEHAVLQGSALLEAQHICAGSRQNGCICAQHHCHGAWVCGVQRSCASGAQQCCRVGVKDSPVGAQRLVTF